MAQQNLRIGWVGFHKEGIAALRSLLESGIRLEGVITLDDGALARRSAGADYAGILAPYGVPLHAVASINDASSVSLLRDMRLDLLFVIGWSQILGPDALASARLGAVGAHASLLPHNRGSAPINWGLIRGEAVAGNTLIWLTEGVDEGGIIDQIAFPATPYDTCKSLYDKVAATNETMIARLLPRLFAGDRPGRPQPPSDEPVLPRRRPADGLLDWGQPAQQVYDFVRALTRPYPGAFSFLDGERWILQACALLPIASVPGARPGTVLGPVVSPIAAACGQVVACGSGSVVVLEVEGAGGQILTGTTLSEQEWKGMMWANE